MSVDYTDRASRYWMQSEQAYSEGDPRLGDELADLAAQCDQWAHEDGVLVAPMPDRVDHRQE